MSKELPKIDDYALTCMRHPSFEAGYRQWLKVVSAWGYDASDGTWTADYYKSLWMLE